ncbi:MAG: sulfatase-like hydrolase/transferase [Opitutaceae bacterium]|nr:sulfatase-like hydrolase/transferase [Opitutaceae bacterium]
MTPLRSLVVLFLASAAVTFAAAPSSRPNIVLVMADDMGWGQTSYIGHPVLKTPNLDAMAKAGLRFDRFYAGAPNCSPTRATVMTGRSNDRTGVENHGYALRRQEKTLPRALRDAGYVTGHFGKWHLNGFRGPGAPVLGTDDHNPGEFGFDDWLSVTNFFDRDPLMSRKGKFEAFKGDSSEIIVDEALKFITRNRDSGKPIFAMIWYGSPHAPFAAAPGDKKTFGELERLSQDHYGELVAMDRSIGTLRQGLRKLGIADNTLVWFNSDNGGLPEVKPSSVGELRGFKNSVYEGGLRVPGIIEWPAMIKTPRITRYPAGTVDIFPTIADILGLPASAMLKPIDGMSIKPLFTADLKERAKPLAFRHTGRAALVDNRYKIVTLSLAAEKFEVYDLEADPKETTDISGTQPEVARKLRDALLKWNESVKASYAGKDYPEGKVNANEPPSRDWTTAPEYQPYLAEWQKRPEYKPSAKGKKKAKK